MAVPSHNYDTRQRLKRLAAQLNEEEKEEASQQPQEDSIIDNVNVHDSDVKAPGSPPKELLHNEASSNNKNAGKKRFKLFDMFTQPRPKPRKLSNEVSHSGDAYMYIVDFYNSDNESDLSGFSDEDPDSIPNTSEDDDFDYEDVKKFSISSGPLRSSFVTAIDIMAEHLKAYWERLTLLNESRKKSIKELNGQITKSRKFSYSDIYYFNLKIRSIERNLNVGIPVVSNMKATYVRGSQKQQVLYQGFKFSKHCRIKNIFACTYNENPRSKYFGGSNSCNGYLVVDEKGFLQPGSYVTHYHSYVKVGYKVHDNVAPKCDPVKLPRLTPEDGIAGKRFKLNAFLSAKLQESAEYSNEVCRVMSMKYFIDEQLGKLRSLNGPQFTEEEQTYLTSYIQWVEQLLQHITIVDVDDEMNNIQKGEKEATKSKGGRKRNNKVKKGIKKNV